MSAVAENACGKRSSFSKLTPATVGCPNSRCGSGPGRGVRCRPRRPSRRRPATSRFSARSDPAAASAPCGIRSRPRAGRDTIEHRRQPAQILAERVRRVVTDRCRPPRVGVRERRSRPSPGSSTAPALRGENDRAGHNQRAAAAARPAPGAASSRPLHGCVDDQSNAPAHSPQRALRPSHADDARSARAFLLTGSSELPFGSSARKFADQVKPDPMARRARRVCSRPTARASPSIIRRTHNLRCLQRPTIHHHFRQAHRVSDPVRSVR